MAKERQRFRFCVVPPAHLKPKTKTKLKKLNTKSVDTKIDAKTSELKLTTTETEEAVQTT